MAKITTAQPKFKILVSNLRSGSDPSRGTAGNPVKLRTGFEKQFMPELPRGSGSGRVWDPHTPGTETHQGLMAWTVGATPVGGTAAITVVSNNFTFAANLYIGQYTITSGQDFSTGVAVQATATATVVATPSTATLTIGGQALTATAGARTPGNNDYDGTLGTPALIAADIQAAINDVANAFGTIATASAPVGAAVPLVAVPLGALGNAVTLATTDVLDITVSGPLFTSGVNAVDNTATALAAAIDGLPGFTASAVGALVSITGPFGLDGNNQVFEALYNGTVANYTLAPTTGFFQGAEPFFGPPTILP